MASCKIRRDTDIIHTQMIPCFPDEITEDILLRVPVERLLEFKCVAKSWCALISSKRFIRTHLKNSNKDTGFSHHRIIIGKFWKKKCFVSQYSLQSFEHDSSIDALDLPPTRWTINARKQVRFLGSINGLCCVILDYKDYFIWNPCMRMPKKLPDLDCKIRYLSRYGFGFDDSNEDYKVLLTYTRFGYNPRSKEDKFSIRCGSLYSLKSNSWKRIEHFHVGGTSYDGHGQFVNGRLHWLKHGGSPKSYFVYFDLGSELCGMLELPTLVYSHYTLGVLDGCLCLLHDYYSSHQTDLWIYAQYGVKESLVKLVTIPRIGSPDLIYTPLCRSPRGVILLLNGSEFVSFDPRRDYFMRLQPNNKSMNPNNLLWRAKGYLSSSVYVKSLVSPFNYDD